MASRLANPILLLLFIVFTLANPSFSFASNVTVAAYSTANSNSTAVNNVTAAAYSAPAANVTTAANSTTAETGEKAWFLCTYNIYVSKVVFIDKNTDSFHGLQAQIAGYFHDNPAKLSISYAVDDNYLAASDLEWVEITTDQDVRNLMAYYESFATTSNPVGIRLNVTAPDHPPVIFWVLVGIFGVFVLLIFLVFAIAACCRACFW